MCATDSKFQLQLRDLFAYRFPKYVAGLIAHRRVDAQKLHVLLPGRHTTCAMLSNKLSVKQQIHYRSWCFINLRGKNSLHGRLFQI
jgi:hypothetical protein